MLFTAAAQGDFTPTPFEQALVVSGRDPDRVQCARVDATEEAPDAALLRPYTPPLFKMKIEARVVFQQAVRAGSMRDRLTATGANAANDPT